MWNKLKNKGTNERGSILVFSGDAKAGQCDVAYISAKWDLNFYVQPLNLPCERESYMLINKRGKSTFFVTQADRQFLIK